MSIVRWKPLIHQLPLVRNPSLSLREQPKKYIRCCPKNPSLSSSAGFVLGSKPDSGRNLRPIVEAKAAQSPPLSQETDLISSEQFTVNRIKKTYGKVSVKLERRCGYEARWMLEVSCDLVGKWVLHWGVSYCDNQAEWDQPPPEMIPPGSTVIKDYAIESPLNAHSEGQSESAVQIEIDGDTPIGAINFVLKEEETGRWYHNKGRDFRVPLRGSSEDEITLSMKQSVSIWPEAFDQISNMLRKHEESDPAPAPILEDNSDTSSKKPIIAFHEDYTVIKEEPVQNSMTVTVRKSDKSSDKNIVDVDTDIPGHVVLHWGVYMNESKNWHVPPPPYPPATKVLRKSALQTLLEKKSLGLGNRGTFALNKEVKGLVFVLKLDEYTWVNNMGKDFVVPIENSTSGNEEKIEEKPGTVSSTDKSVDTGAAPYTENLISGIRNLVDDISSHKNKAQKTNEEQDNILHEIEKLVVEAYRIFKNSSVVEKPDKSVDDTSTTPTQLVVSSGTGNGHEILCQGFNWESHKSGRWYHELGEKAKLLAELGFSIVWLPPPTESVSPEGYMPTDLYNLNSKYGNIEELKDIVHKFREVGIKVLGDVVLNHRCATSCSENGIWNIFGGRLNWDARAIVADDPHFQGKGNKSSGDNFHAAPNIDHSQEFVRTDIKEWLCYLRKEVGYDGWRLDFVRGFWGGYVKDYLEASQPYFAVGEYWDSLSYTYGEMDYNQNAHRQRIIDWINATNGTAGAFDVTTKGILHSVLERCEYWRLSDEKAKPPGVLGWWPSRAVTFIENHDTGSTQGHWRFPAGKEMQGYAYILTHPGTPSVFFDHVFCFQEEIRRLISLRLCKKIHCRSTVKILKAEKDVYAAEIDGKVAMKIGPGFYEPERGPKNWTVAAEGADYKVWEAS
ncbi:Alpha-amylase [Rhynchospora pubera]|uniref:Alpha-amylase n=1 Tax=Rhynchospora pubera TaxID=906938 RepID=A0AAV8GVT6_9POAL|nr:Alpha-amylase [Rhynchospora pubera]